MESEHDIINNPSHYTDGRKFQPIDVINDWNLGYNLGNAVKYISRAGRKGSKVEDLQKAVFYLNYEINKCKNDGQEHTEAGG